MFKFKITISVSRKKTKNILKLFIDLFVVIYFLEISKKEAKCSSNFNKKLQTFERQFLLKSTNKNC